MYSNPTQVQATIEQNAGVSFSSVAVSFFVSLIISDINVAPMMDGASANVCCHRILHSQAYELVSTGPTQDVCEHLTNPRDNFALASAGDSMNQIKNWLVRSDLYHLSSFLHQLLVHPGSNVHQHFQLILCWAILLRETLNIANIA